MTSLVVMFSFVFLCQSSDVGAQENNDLAYFAGEWVGTGNAGKFREETSYTWSEDKTSLKIDMKFF